MMVQNCKVLDTLELDLVKDDDIYGKLEELQKNLKIKRATYQGIGAGKEMVVGFLEDIEKVSYKHIKCEGRYEISSFIGNIKDGKFHTHITLANSIANLTGGHFVKGKVAYIMQIYIQVLEYYKK